MFGAEGLINMFLKVLGLVELSQTSWIGSQQYAIWTLILLRMWQFGSPMIIFLAGLKQIPKSLLEAADIDGASRWEKTKNVTLPILSPIILFNFVMQIISAFKVFTSAYIMTNGTGGVLDSMLIYTIHIYNEGFKNFKMGYASALSWIFMLIVGTFTLAAFKLSAKKIHYN
jgi:multiple sugar transport system permease protein